MTEPTARARRRTGPPSETTGVAATDRVAELEARLARLERAPGLRERGRSVMDRVIPPEASEHFRNAGREQLLGVRSIVDFWIRRLDEADTRAAGRFRDRETIEIE
ncbi:MAG TPA: hypothetical protein VKB00_02025 [Candidatus Limnocylindrales bacterium]|jgi:hypothetical protein|nr:hypothetical protein [Candidatus Limnocylindrales bacterium]